MTTVITLCFLITSSVFVSQVMLTCWTKDPKLRPPFSSLYQHFEFFGPDLINSKYSQSVSAYMKQNNMTNNALKKGTTDVHASYDSLYFEDEYE